MKADEKGCWAIRVFTPITNNKIIFIVSPNNIHIAYSLNSRQINEMEVQAYFKNINDLKKFRARKKAIITAI